MSTETGVSKEDIIEMIARTSVSCSVIEESNEDDDNFMFQIPDHTNEPVKFLEMLEFEEYLNELPKIAKKELTDRESDVIHRRYIEGDASLKELGQEYGVSFQRIQQIEKRALGKLKEALDKSLEDHTIEA